MKITVPLIKPGDQGNGCVISKEALDKFMEDYKKNPSSLAIGGLNHIPRTIAPGVLDQDYQGSINVTISDGQDSGLVSWMNDWRNLMANNDSVNYISKVSDTSSLFWCVGDIDKGEIVKVFLENHDAMEFLKTDEEKYALIDVELPPKITKLPKEIYLFYSATNHLGYVTLFEDEEPFYYNYHTKSEKYICKRDEDGNSWTPVSREILKPITPNVHITEDVVVWPINQP